MTLRENSKANIICCILMLIGTIIPIVNSIRSICEYQWYIIPIIINIIPLCILGYGAIKIIKTSNVEKVFNIILGYFISVPICSIISTLTRIFIYAEMISILDIIYTIVLLVILNILPILALNIMLTNKDVVFFKTTVIIELVFSIIGLILYFMLPFIAIRGIIGTFLELNNVPLIFYIALLIYVNNVVILHNDSIAREIKYIKEENIAKNVILTIITFGVYGYIWLYRMSRNIKCLNNDKSSLTGELLCLLFVPFYMLYWVYTRAKAIKTQADCRNIQISDGATLYLILSLLGLNIVSIALMQNDLNVVLRNKEKPIIQNGVENNSQKEITDIEKISQLSELKEKGILTAEEYQKKKQEILDRI